MEQKERMDQGLIYDPADNGSAQSKPAVWMPNMNSMQHVPVK